MYLANMFNKTNLHTSSYIHSHLYTHRYVQQYTSAAPAFPSARPKDCWRFLMITWLSSSLVGPQLDPIFGCGPDGGRIGLWLAIMGKIWENNELWNSWNSKSSDLGDAMFKQSQRVCSGRRTRVGGKQLRLLPSCLQKSKAEIQELKATINNYRLFLD